MAVTKRDRIEEVNKKILKLMLDRARIRRYSNDWNKEQALTDQILELEKEIRAIRDERNNDEGDDRTSGSEESAEPRSVSEGTAKT